MKRYIIKLAFIAISFTCAIANAALVTWDYRGQITFVNGNPQYNVNDLFRVLVTFDTNAVETGSNSRRHSYDPSLVSYDYEIGANGWQHIDYSPTFGGLIYLRDDQANPDNNFVGPLVDGITFSLSDANFSGGLDLIVRTFDLNAINGVSLPSVPFALNNLSANAFQAKDTDGNLLISGTINSITAVPEPSSIASLAIGLMALCAIARRKALFGKAK